MNQTLSIFVEHEPKSSFYMVIPPRILSRRGRQALVRDRTGFGWPRMRSLAAHTLP